MPGSHHQQRLLYCFVAAVFILVIGVAILGYMRSKDDQTVPIKSLKSAQQADAPLGFHIKTSKKPPPFDPRFIQLSAFERAMIPKAVRMTSALGTEQAALTYNAQAYWRDNKRRGGNHTGDDLNGIGGMNTDLGDPVFAMANGLVIYRGEPSSGWGKILILAHRNEQGEIIQSMYAHLDKSYAPFGDLIPRSEIIGTVGTANLNYAAHLHLEMRTSTGVPIGAGYTANPGENIDPAKTLKSYQSKFPERIHISPLAIVLQERIDLRKEQLFGM
ncbi:MAG: M23 family metallopeptidase [Verrucomicrobiae bacterium]|nr:M23 family metallopeptidase [Verrucomicrobiae bacterium]NNJ87034.1 M23 family metallopeptidase [Akkermansiaceae bacterium]